ncbi:ROK family protein [Halalkalibacterium halodurans]|nr:ROK family protein [Halalkalibacterium halodurans]MED4122673.1 ROK family protein [Halalkalibacterium halodurans]MED4171466.1 ROK family protein [Halalkalibacterium halodurans]
MKMAYLLTIDIGGTFTKMGLVSVQAQLVEKIEQPTPSSLPIFCQMVDEYYERFSQRYNIIGIAMSCPGSVTSTGDVLGSSAVEFIHENNLKRTLEDTYGLPVAMENDANCAAIAEGWNGAAQGVSTFACIVCGTGIGGAFVLDGKLHRGAHLHGGEFGYAIMNVGERGDSKSWSEIGSSVAIVNRLKGEPPHGERWTGYLAFEEAAKGHEKAQESIDVFFQSLAVGVFNLQYMFDPEKIFIGGGITRQPGFMKELEKRLAAIFAARQVATIRPSLALCQHLDQAQLFGAAKRWLDEHQRGKDDG